MSDVSEQGSDTPNRHIVLLAILVAISLLIRLKPIEKFFVDGDVLFYGADAYYHYRHVQYIVQNWPWTLGTDLFTAFPHGASSGQFGALFDWIIATVALIIGFGSPTPETVKTVLLISPAVFGALATIPVYAAAKRISTSRGGLIAAVILTLQPGIFLQRTTVGFADHHAAEILFHAVAAFCIIAAIQSARKEEITLQTLRDPTESATVKWSAIAAGATAIYVYTWPSGILLIGIVAVFAVLRMLAVGLRGDIPTRMGTVVAVYGVVLTVLLIPGIEVAGVNIHRISLLHLAATGGLVVWGVGVIKMIERGMVRHVIAGIVTVCGLVAGAVLLSPQLQYWAGRVVSIVLVSLGPDLVSETAPITVLTNPSAGVGIFDVLILQYGLTFITALIFVLYMLLYDERDYDEQWFVILWFLLITNLAFTQVRFNYYLALPVAVMNGYGIHHLIKDEIPSESADGILTERMKGWFAVICIFMLVLVIPIPLGETKGNPAVAENAYQRVDDVEPDGEEWMTTLEWMKDNTPAPGRADGKGEPLHPYQTSLGETHPNGSYGVMALWDYGHLITTEAERIPYSNPLQDGRQINQQFFSAKSESEADRVLDKHAGGERLKYVIVDWKTTSIMHKYPAVVGIKELDRYGVPLFTAGYNQFIGIVKTDEYYRSMAVRLYRYHGSAVEPSPITLSWRNGTDNGRPISVFESVTRHDNVTTAKEYAMDNEKTQVGGVAALPPEHIPALEHYRVVKMSEVGANNKRLNTVSEHLPLDQSKLTRTSRAWVKVFERVPGASVTGTAPPNTTVVATVQLHSPGQNSTFTYRQYARTGENGRFEMTLPYSTTGYDEWRPEQGYTNVSVRATGPYTFSVVGSNVSTAAHVPEGAVNGGSNTTVNVTVSDN